MRPRPGIVILATLVLYVLLAQPNHPDALTWELLLIPPLELPALLLALVALGDGRKSQLFRSFVTGTLLLIVALKAADFAMFSALGRGFNPVADLALIGAGVNVLSGAIGSTVSDIVMVIVFLSFIGVAAATWWATGTLAELKPVSTRSRAIAGGLALAGAGVAAVEVGERMQYWALPIDPPGTAFTARVGMERWIMAQDTWADLQAFEAAAAHDPLIAQGGLFDRIDRDVIVVFIESYGRTSLDTPLFAGTHRATLMQQEQQLASKGLAMASGLVASPTRGGQSWLAHATFANGLWVDGQTRYSALLASSRRSLYHLAAEAGFHTAAVMPQITLDWPESQSMGFETIIAAKDLEYAGSNFNWVTMPDQFTYLAMDRLLLTNRPDNRPFFIQVATGSSHAPWVPVPELIDWESVGDGSVFDEMAEMGDPPDVVWRDKNRVREQYRQAIDYALRAVFAYAARSSGEPPLMIMLGDHQAAGFVALDRRPDVPLHVVGPAHLVEHLAATLKLSPGLIPNASSAVLPMDQLRDRLVQSFSSQARFADETPSVPAD